MGLTKLKMLSYTALFLISSCGSNSQRIENNKSSLKIDADSVLVKKDSIVPENNTSERFKFVRGLPEINKEESCHSLFETQTMNKAIKELIEIPKGNYELVKGRLIKESYLLLYKKKNKRNDFLLASYFFPRKRIQDSIVFDLDGCNNLDEIETKLVLNFPFRIALIGEDTMKYRIKWNGSFTKEN